MTILRVGQRGISGTNIIRVGGAPGVALGGGGGSSAQPTEGASFDTWLPTAPPRPLNDIATTGTFDTWISNTVPLDRRM